METSPLICGTICGAGFYMITASVMKGLTFSWIQPQILLRCCLIHITIIIHLILNIQCICGHVLAKFYLYCICVISMWFVFHFHLHFHYDSLNNHAKISTLLFWLFFRICPFLEYYLWMITRMKNLNNVPIANFRVLLSICFLQSV